jgi:hypothetical protein
VKAGRSPTGKNKSGWVFMEAMAFFKEGGGSNQDQLVSSVSNGRYFFCLHFKLFKSTLSYSKAIHSKVRKSEL